MTNHNNLFKSIRSDLSSKAGVKPSQHWLEDCLSALQQQQQQPQQQNSNLADACLHQILHHDLRDVIRTFGDDDDENDINNNNHDTVDTINQGDNNLPSVQLRKAILESRTSPTKKAELKAPSFRKLMIQVEEFVDVSRGATARLETASTSANNNTSNNNNNNNPRNPSSRCLKLAFSDGYHPVTGLSKFPINVDENDPPNNNDINNPKVHLLVAMEVTAIPQLSSSCLAGLKLLLTPPIVVRHGVLMLHPGNAFVLGGHVPELAALQKQALEQARRLAGVGVDPTIRALIGPEAEVLSNATGDGVGDDGEDEGEHASRDVEPTTTTQFQQTAVANAAPTAQQPRHTPLPLNNNTTSSRATNTTTTAAIPTMNPYSQQQQPVSGTNLDSTSSRTVTSTSITDIEMIQGNDDVDIDVEMILNSSMMSTTSTRTVRDPSSNSGNNSNCAGPLPSNPYLSQSRAAHEPVVFASVTTTSNPYTASNVNRNMIRTAAPSTGPSSTNPYSINASSGPTSSSNPYTAGSSNFNNGMSPSSAVAAVSSTPIRSQHPQTFHVTDADGSKQHLKISFENLRSLLLRMLNNPQRFREYQGRMFVSEVRQVGPRLDFNIDKIKKPAAAAAIVNSSQGSSKSKKSKAGDKQYEYRLVIKLGGKGSSNDPNQQPCITTKVSSEFQQLYFQLPPREMREWSKANHAEANAAVRERGEAIWKLLDKCQWFKLTLLVCDNNNGNESLSCDNGNGGMPAAIDGNEPILLLLGPASGTEVQS